MLEIRNCIMLQRIWMIAFSSSTDYAPTATEKDAVCQVSLNHEFCGIYRRSPNTNWSRRRVHSDFCFQRCDASLYESNLMADLLTGYHPMARPVLRDDTTILVHFNLSLRNVLDLNEDTGQLSVRLWLKMVSCWN